MRKVHVADIAVTGTLRRIQRGRIVVQDIDPPKVVEHGGNHRRDPLLGSQVGLDGQSLATPASISAATD